MKETAFTGRLWTRFGRAGWLCARPGMLRLGYSLRAAAFALVSAPLITACAGDAEPSEARETPNERRMNGITSGVPTSDYEYVVKLLDINRVNVRCSASLISDRVLLTAAHCLVGDARSLCARLETTNGVTDVAIDAQAVHPEFSVLEPMAASFANDLALLRLAVPVPVSPVSVELNVPVAAGELVRVVGYGRTGAGQHDEGTRRFGESEIMQLGHDTFELQGESLPCIFDSGGLVQAPESGNQVGVISSGAADCVHHAEIARLDTARSFILEVLEQSERAEQHPELACEPPAVGAAPAGSLEGSCAAASARANVRSTSSLLCGLVLVTAYRRRRTRRQRTTRRLGGGT
jgi:hypothetical protein